MVLEGAARYILGVIVIIGGLLFIFSNKPISKGAAEFYRKFYTAKNLSVIFRVVGIIIILIGIFILVKG